MKAGMTVEAAYIFPMSFLILAIVCFLGIFQYDQAVLKMTGYECILRSLEQDEEASLKDTLYQRAQSVAEERVLALHALQTEVQVTKSKVSVTYQGILGVLEIPVKITVSYERTNPEQTLWRTRIITGEG